MSEKKKSIRALAEELKAIRKRPISQESIDRFNRIREKDERLQGEEAKRKSNPVKKIARAPETDL
jgi:hypothetical protein